MPVGNSIEHETSPRHVKLNDATVALRNRRAYDVIT